RQIAHPSLLLSKGDTFTDPVTSDKVTSEDVNGFSKYAASHCMETRMNVSDMFEQVKPKDM
ncbi:MAG: hypothetical protein M1830_007662, partial [Pleopsidium flavum]